MVMTRFGNNNPEKTDINRVATICFKSSPEDIHEDDDYSGTQCIFMCFNSSDLRFCACYDKFAWDAARECKGSSYISKVLVHKVLMKHKNKILKYMEDGYLRYVL